MPIDPNEQVSPTLRCAIIATALALEGLKVREHGGQNRGEVVERLLKRAGGAAGMAWCVAFCDFVYENACATAGVKPALNPGLSCSALVVQARKLGRVFETPSRVRPGDLMVLRGGPTGFKHVGVCLGPPDEDALIETIEGNTNEAGSAEGDGVYCKHRNPVATPCVFIRTGEETE